MKYTGVLFLVGLLLTTSAINTVEAIPPDAGELDWFIAFATAVLGFVSLMSAVVRLRR